MANEFTQEFLKLRDRYIERGFGRLNPVQKQAVFRKHKKLTLAAAAVLSWIGSLAGFGDLISVIFPVFGYLSVVFLVCMIVHFIQCKRREKQSA